MKRYSRKEIIEKIESEDAFIIDGGLSNVLEGKGSNLNSKLWTAQLISENPDAIINAHRDYIKAGAQCITTASYQASIWGFVEEGYSPSEGRDLILRSVLLAERAIEKTMEEKRDLKRPLIAASIGPYGAFLADGSEYSGKYRISKDDLEAFHLSRIELLDSSSADLLAIETIPNLDEAEVIAKLLKEVKTPSWVSFSCRNEEELNDGSKIVDAIALFGELDNVLALGVNCTKARYISGLIGTIIKRIGKKKVIVYPNSGEEYNAKNKTWKGFSKPDQFISMAKEWSDLGCDIIGGCCRIGPKHILELSTTFQQKS